MQPGEDKREHLVIYDYGTGGIWCLIAARSPCEISERYPALRVVTAGDPDWVTGDKYSEIVREWVSPAFHFDIDRPTGWLAECDDGLSKTDS